MRASSAWLIGLLGLGILVACERKAEPSPGAGPAGGPTALAGGPEASAGLPVVRLLEPGAAPRRALRYRFGSRDKVVMEMVMDMGMKMSIGGQSPPEIQLPPMKMWMAIQPEEVRPDGALRYTFRLDKTEVLSGDSDDQAMVQTLRGELARTEGMSGHAVVDPRGFTQEADMQVPPGAGQQVKDMVEKLRQQMRQMSCPLPEEPVGVGARWEVLLDLQTDMFRVDQRAVYTLTELEGERARMDISVVQGAPAQDVQVPNLPGAKAHLLGLESTGSGRMSVELQRLVPESHVTSKTHMQLRLAAGGQAPQDIVTDLTMKLSLRPQ